MVQFEELRLSLLDYEEKLKKAFDFCEGYKDYLDFAKIERESVEFFIKEAESKAFVMIDVCYEKVRNVIDQARKEFDYIIKGKLKEADGRFSAVIDVDTVY